VLVEIRNILLHVLSSEKVIQQFDFGVIIYLHRKGIIIIFPQIIITISFTRDIRLLNSRPFIHCAAQTKSVETSYGKKS